MNEAQDPLPCPRCGGKMVLKTHPGSKCSFPEVSLTCSGVPKSCSWRLCMGYDELSGRTTDSVAAELVAHYNEGILNARKRP